MVFDKNKNTLITPVCHLQVTEKKKYLVNLLPSSISHIIF